jgi:hypothetical protein
MRKLTGLLVFAVALAGAILLTSYYKQKYASPAPPTPAQTVAPAAPAAPAADARGGSPPAQARGNAPFTFKTQTVALDPAGKKARVTFTLERDPARPAPATVWVWAYFFSTDAPGRYCSGEPVEVRQPWADKPGADGHVEIKAELPVKDCPAPRDASSRYYARVNVSAESAFAARLTEQRISYDTTQASPVTVETAKPAGR